MESGPRGDKPGTPPEGLNIASGPQVVAAEALEDGRAVCGILAEWGLLLAQGPALPHFP